MTIQEELFCKVYVQTGSKIKSAYHAFLCNNLKDKVAEKDLTKKHHTNLKSAGQRLLNKEYIQVKLLELYDKEIERVGIAKLNEMLEYLSFVLRKSKDDIKNNSLRKDAIKACEVMLRRYDYKDTGIDSIKFSRGTQEIIKEGIENGNQIN